MKRWRRRWHCPQKPLVHQIWYLNVVAVDALSGFEEPEGPNFELLDGAIVGKLDLTLPPLLIELGESELVEGL